LLRAEAGKPEMAFDDIETCYRFGRHLKGMQTIVGHLLGGAIENQALDTARKIVGAHEDTIDQAAIKNLQEHINEAKVGECFMPSFNCERLSIYDEIQRCFTDGVDGGHLNIRRINTIGDVFGLVSAGELFLPDKHNVNRQQQEGLLDELSDIVWDFAYGIVEFGQFAGKAGYVLFFHPDKEQTRRAADLFCTRMEDYSEMTPAERRNRQVDIDAAAEELTKGNVLLEMMCPAVGKISEISYQNKANAEATVAVIAAIRFEKETGAFPASLEQLVDKGYLRETPIDPYSDKPLVYRRVGDSFTLYSVGKNFDDDGGVGTGGKSSMWANDGDTVFWPVEE
jgi:hypothetical protein